MRKNMIVKNESLKRERDWEKEGVEERKRGREGERKRFKPGKQNERDNCD